MARARILPAEAVRAAQPVWLGSLDAAAPAPLRASDLDTEIGRAAYQLGRRRGLAEGQAQGLRHGQAQACDEAGRLREHQGALCAERLNALAEGFRGELEAAGERLADEVAALALAIARQVLRRELAAPETVQAVAREALATLARDAGRLELRVHPAQAAFLAPVLAEHSEAGEGGAVTLRPDPSIVPGGCRLLASTGEVDATVAARWDAVLAGLDWPRALVE